MSSTSTRELSLLDLAHILVRRRRLAGGIFFGCLMVTLSAACFWPRQYVSESKLYIRLGRESGSLDPAAVVGRPSAVTAIPPTRENEINSVTEIFLSRVLLDRVVDAIGPKAILRGSAPESSEPNADRALAESGSPNKGAVQFASFALDAEWPSTLSDRDRAIIKLRKNLDVQAVKKSDVVRVTYESPDPRLSQVVVANLVEQYLDEHLRLNRTRGAREFLEHQTAEMRTRLAAAEEGLRGLKDRTGLASVESQRAILVTRAGRLEDELLTTEAALKSTEAEVAALKSTLSGLPKVTVTSSTVGMPNHGADLMHNELYRLQMLENELTAKYTDEHTLVKEIRDRVAKASKVYKDENATREQVTKGDNPLYDQAELALLKCEPQFDALRAKAATLRTQLEQVCEQIKTLNANEVQIAEQSRDMKQYEDHFQAYSQHLEQARIDEALEDGRISSVSIIQPATYEPKASSPRLAMILSVGILLGLIGAVAWPLLVESFDLPRRGAREAEKALSVGTLATASRFTAEQLVANGHAT